MADSTHSPLILEDQKWMRLALALAQKAQKQGEVPVGAVIVGPTGLISSAFNLREKLQTSLGHAEVLAIHRASKRLRNWRLEDCTLYVTLEPCLMCAGTIQQSRIKRVVFGAPDEKAGVVQSMYTVLQDHRFNHTCEVRGGVLAEECGSLLTDFFSQKRNLLKEEKKKITYRERAEVLVFKDNHVLIVKLKDPLSGRLVLTLPGGVIEEGELPEQAAVREALEETGYQVNLISDLSVTKTYQFFWRGALRPCRTTYFLGQLKNEVPSPVQDAEYNAGYEWIHENQIPMLWKDFPEPLAAFLKLKKKKHLLKRSPK